MTKEIDYSSKEWAIDVAERLSEALAGVQDAAHVLSSLVQDMDADGNDAQRGPHAPPVEDVRVLLRMASFLLSQQSGNWYSHALHREGVQRRSARAKR